MPRRAVIAIGLAVAVVFAGALSLVIHPTPDGGTLISRVGGFSIEVPAGWTANKRRPRDGGHNYYVIGRHPALLGLGSSEGFHVARWEAADFDTLRRDVSTYAGEGAHTEEAVVAGHRALITTSRCQDRGVLNVMLRHRSHCRSVSFIAGRFVYQVGTWSWSGVPDATIAATFRARTPVPWTTTIPGTHAQLTLPGGWTQRKGADLKGATLVAYSPGQPVDAWAYLFHFKGISVTDQIAKTRHNIEGGGGTNIVQTGRRLDFLFPDEGHPNPAHDTEWFRSDGHGGTFVLAVGYRAGDPDIGERIARTWRNAD
jgi:hypothetical protein